MSLESADFIPGLVASNPEGTDPKSQGDDHLRMLKHVLKTQFPAFLGAPVTKTEAELNAGLNQGDFGLGASPFVPGVSVTDANTITATGFYNLEPPFTNGPTATYYTIIHMNAGVSAVQLAFLSGTQDSEMYMRAVTGSWGAWERIWTNQNLVLQTGPADIVPGRVLTVGAFGLGASNNATDLFGKDLNNYKVGGFYRVVAPIVNGPVAAEAILLVTNSADMGSQIFWNYLDGTMYTRTWLGSSFKPWARVGGVSSELIATNGYRVTNNLVEQWGKSVSIGDDQSVSVVFPIAMAECYSVTATPNVFVSNVTFICPGITNVSGSQFTLSNMNNGGAACPFFWRATGRLV